MQFYRYLQKSKISQAHYLLLFFLTIILFNIEGLGMIPGILDKPQFTTVLDSDWIERTLFADNPWLQFSYYTFFILDFIWAPILVLAIWMYVRKEYYLFNASPWALIVFSLFTLVSIGALCFDAWENTKYLNGLYSKNIVLTKKILYGIIFFIYLLVFIKYSLKSRFKTLLVFIKSAAISLIILGIIGVLLPEAPQVNSIIVDLYYYPINLLILFIVAPFYAVILAHYPSYFDIDESQKKWYMAKFRIWLIGVISYRHQNRSVKSKNEAVESDLNFLLRILGIAFYGALFYMIGYASETNFDWPISISKLSISLLACGILLLYFLKRSKDKWLNDNFINIQRALPCFYDGDYTPPEQRGKKGNIQGRGKVQLAEINEPILWYLIFFIVTVILHVILFVLLFACEECRYNFFTAVLSLICIAFQMVTFILFRTFRSVFRFSFFNAKFGAVLNSFYILRNIDEKHPKDEERPDCEEWSKSRKIRQILKYFQENNFTSQNRLLSLFSKLGFGALSNNITFLQFTVLLGIVNLIFYLIINIWSELSIYFNPSLIILSALFLYYGIIVVILKNLIYYGYSQERFALQNSTKFKFALAVSILIIVLFNRLAQLPELDNNLYTLDLVERNKKEELSLEKYVVELPKNQPRYYVGCYGGGMKSNAWTMIALNELRERDHNFYEKVVCLSGASGGTMGLINISSIVKENDSASYDAIIKKIGTQNILSLDIAHILGRDNINHLLVPKINLRGKDRSTKALNRYAFLSNNQDQICKETAYRVYWKEIYDNYEKRFPILISNTTNVEGNQGMAVSVKSEDKYINSVLYNGANNILEIEMTHSNGKSISTKNFTLSYYDAASTSNRFPILSSAAKVETIGYFNDGGFSENSGLGSAFKLFKAVNHLENVVDLDSLAQRNVFINIVNDKNLYIRHYLKNTMKGCKANKIKEYLETSSVLSSISSTETLPIHIKSELKRLSDNHINLEFETIYLPHRFTMNDVKNIYGEDLYCDSKNLKEPYKVIYEKIKDNDINIASLVVSKCKEKTPIVEPPMSRVMAVPAFDFMTQMLEHEIPGKAMDKIIDDFIKN